MRQAALVVVALVALAPPAWGQVRPGARGPQPPMAADTPVPARPGMGPGMMQRGDPERRRMLLQQVEERWGRRVQEELSLSDQQMDRLRAATRAHQDRRRDLMRRQADLDRLIMAQLQPGVAANSDSLNRLLDARARVRVENAQADEQLNRDLSFMTPVQRARFFMMQRRFEEQLRMVRQRMQQGQGPMRQGMGPAQPPGPRPPVPGQRPLEEIEEP